MAVSILLFKRGLKQDLPSSAPLGEPYICSDTRELYIGMGEDQPIGAVTTEDGLKALELIEGLTSKVDKVDEIRVSFDEFKEQMGVSYDDFVKNVNQQITYSNNRVKEAVTKASDPITTMESQGNKIGINLLSDEVLSAMSGETPISASKGFDINRGVDYPLKNVVRKEILSTLSDTLKNGILDIKIFGAKPNKYYKLSYIGNGITFYNKIFYGIYLLEFDKDTYASTGEPTKTIFSRLDHCFEEPTKSVVTWNLSNEDEGISISITLDFSVLVDTKYDMNTYTTNVGYSSIIDESCYVFNPVKEQEINTGILSNKGIDYPLKNVVRKGVLSTLSDTLQKGILDIKIFGAKKDKYYKISYIGNGVKFNDKAFYGVYLLEFDKDTYASDGSAYKTIFSRTNHCFTPPADTGVFNDIVTWNLTNEEEGISLSITLDFSVLTLPNYDMNTYTTNAGYSSIVDESCYILSTDGNGLNDDTSNVLYNMAVKRVGRNYYVKYKYDDTKNLVIRFGAIKNNAFTHPNAFYWEHSEKLTLDISHLEEFQSNNTDWLSPYGMMATEDALNTKSFTVGGAHATGGSTGFATGSYIDSTLYADNVAIEDGEGVYCNEVVIRSEHYISASNVINTETGDRRDSAKEVTIWKITKGNIEVGVTLQALEGIKLTRYAGIQATRSIWSKKLYVPSDNNTVFDMANTTDGFNSKPYPDFKSDRFVMHNGSLYLVGYMCKDIGLATVEKAKGTYGVYLTTGEYGKIYMPNIQGNSITLNKGDIAYYSGGYSIQQGLECEYSEGAYYINKNGQRIYCVDFMQNVEKTYLKVLPEDFNKKIQILNKDDSITIGSYISPLGLEISCSSFGSVEFTCL